MLLWKAIFFLKRLCGSIQVNLNTVVCYFRRQISWKTGLVLYQET
jgi:hypothetical protein